MMRDGLYWIMDGLRFPVISGGMEDTSGDGGDGSESSDGSDTEADKGTDKSAEASPGVGHDSDVSGFGGGMGQETAQTGALGSEINTALAEGRAPSQSTIDKALQQDINSSLFGDGKAAPTEFTWNSVSQIPGIGGLLQKGFDLLGTGLTKAGGFVGLQPEIQSGISTEPVSNPAGGSAFWDPAVVAMLTGKAPAPTQNPSNAPSSPPPDWLSSLAAQYGYAPSAAVSKLLGA